MLEINSNSRFPTRIFKCGVPNKALLSAIKKNFIIKSSFNE